VKVAGFGIQDAGASEPRISGYDRDCDLAVCSDGAGAQPGHGRNPHVALHRNGFDCASSDGHPHETGAAVRRIDLHDEVLVSGIVSDGVTGSDLVGVAAGGCNRPDRSGIAIKKRLAI